MNTITHSTPTCPHCGRALGVVPVVPGTVLAFRTCGRCGKKSRVQVRYRPDDPQPLHVLVTLHREVRPV